MNLLDTTIYRLVTALVAMAVLVGLFRFLQGAVTTHVRDGSTRYQLRRALRLAGYAVGIVVLLFIFSGNLRSLTLAFGVIGAGVAFASQEIITSIGGWLANQIGRYYVAGDRIEIAGIKGDVIDVRILRTVMMEMGEWVTADQYTGRLVWVANSAMFKAPVFNYSADFQYLWDEIRLPIGYGSDVRLARETLLRIAEDVVGAWVGPAGACWARMMQRYRVETTPVHPIIYLVTTDNWLELTLRYVVPVRARRPTRDQLFSRMLAAIDQSQGRIRLASATSEIVGLPPLDVTVHHMAPPEPGPGQP